MNLIIDNIADIIVVTMITAGVILALMKMHQDKKTGKSCCGCSSGSCASCRFCKGSHIEGHEDD